MMTSKIVTRLLATAKDEAAHDHWSVAADILNDIAEHMEENGGINEFFTQHPKDDFHKLLQKSNFEAARHHLGEVFHNIMNENTIEIAQEIARAEHYAAKLEGGLEGAFPNYTEALTSLNTKFGSAKPQPPEAQPQSAARAFRPS